LTLKSETYAPTNTAPQDAMRDRPADDFDIEHVSDDDAVYPKP
jgi:hypothetical protein